MGGSGPGPGVERPAPRLLGGGAGGGGRGWGRGGHGGARGASRHLRGPASADNVSSVRQPGQPFNLSTLSAFCHQKIS